MALTMYLKPGEAVVIDGHTSVRLRSGYGHVIIDTLDGTLHDVERRTPAGETAHRSSQGDRK